jgi:spore germination protein
MKTKLLAKLIIIVWLQKNDWQAGVDSVRQNIDLIQEVSPAWFAPSADGSVVQLPGVPVDDPALVSVVRTHGVHLRPIIMNAPTAGFDADLLRTIFSNPALENKHIAAITDLVNTRQYDGVDIDSEGLASNELNQLADFITKLGSQLHANGKTLAVDLQAKYAGQNSPALRQIAAAADSVRLMVYPEHDASTSPGSIASLGWIRDRLSAARGDIPADKLALGMATYAMSWNPSGSGTWAAMAQPIIAKGATRISRDSDGVASFNDGRRVVYFEDAQSIGRKMEVAGKLGISQFALWRLGGEDPTIWALLRSVR